jgi:hypothetical protein
MASASKVSSSIENDIHAAACLLALIAKRPPGLDKLLVRDKEIDHENGDDHTK